MKKYYVIKDISDKDYFQYSGLSSERNGYYAEFTKFVNVAKLFDSKEEAGKELEQIIEVYPSQLFSLKKVYGKS